MKNIYTAKLPLHRAGLEKITVSLGENPWHGFAEELMWVKKVDTDLYQLQNTPFFAKGLAYLDVVFGKLENGRLMFERVKAPSRHSTYRLYVEAATDVSTAQALFDELNFLGCTYESYTGKSWELFAWDVSASVVDSAYEIFNKGEQQGIWSFEEGHYGGREH